MKSLLACLLMLHAFHLHSQSLIATIHVDQVQQAYVDRPGDLYILQKNNVLKKFDASGKLIGEQIFQQSPTLFDPRDGARAFLYDREKQQCSFYSEEVKESYLVEQHYAIEPVLVCSSGEHQIWIVDQSDWSLKRVNPVQSKVMAEALIDQKQFDGLPEFTLMREYQNFLFMLEKKSGILIFNSLGKQIKKIPSAGIEYVNFLGEELYYKKGDKLFFYDLFDAAQRDMVIEPSSKYVLLTDTHTFIVYENKVDIFSK